MDDMNQTPVEYDKPSIADYGELKDLTATNGTAFVDVPLGTPAGPNNNGSTP